MSINEFYEMSHLKKQKLKIQMEDIDLCHHCLNLFDIKDLIKCKRKFRPPSKNLNTEKKGKRIY